MSEFTTGNFASGYDTTSSYPMSIMNVHTIGLSSILNAQLTQFGLWLFYLGTDLNPFLELKIATCLFYGILAVCFYYMLRLGLTWSFKKSFLVTLVFVMEPVILRLGWDLLREELALSFLFVLLGITKGMIIDSTKPKFVIIFSLLIVLTDQAVPVLLFIVIGWQIAIRARTQSMSFRTVVPVLPALIVFIGVLVNFSFFNQILQLPSVALNQGVKGPNILPEAFPTGTSNSFLVNYFEYDPRFIGQSYGTILTYISSLSLYTVVPVIPLAAFGFRKDQIYTPQTLWLIIGGYSVVIYPMFSISDYWRWIILLCVPLTIYASLGVERILKNRSSVSRFVLVGLILFLALLSSVAYSFASLPINSQAESYLPSALSATAFPLSQLPSLERIANYINIYMPQNGTIFASQSYGGILKALLKENLLLVLIPAGIAFHSLIGIVSQQNLSSAYIIWSGQVRPSDNVSLVTGNSNLGLYNYVSL